MMVDLFFGLLLALAAYPYVGYPLLLYLLTRRRPDPTPPASAPAPSVSIVIAAYNESQVIGDAIRNLQNTEYPPDRLKILIGSDGSTDDTVEKARAALRPGVSIQIVDFPLRRGKPAVLRDLLQMVDSEIVALSDANTFSEPSAVRRLVRWFADPTVGCVCGRMDLISSQGRGYVERLYWRFETWLKVMENRLGAVLGANGGNYAFRRSVYEFPEEDAMTDDFVLPMLIRMRGYKIVFDHTAIAREETAPAIRHEYTRRTRIGAGNLQALQLTGGLLTTREGWTAFAYWSHKVARWAAPLLLLMAGLLAVSQIGRPLYAGVVATITLVFTLAATGWAVERSGRRPARVVALPYAFVAMNWALLVGSVRFLRGHRDGKWTRTPRSSTSRTTASDVRTR